MAYKPVDTAITMIVGPCIDDTDFKTLEESIAYNAAGMDVSMIVEKTDGTSAVTAITLTTGGTSDWTHKDGGYYEVEITAAQNIEEGTGFIRGVCTGVLPFESPRYDIVVANVYDSIIKGTDKLQTDAVELSGDSTAADNLELDYDGTGYTKANSTIGTCTTATTTTTNTDMLTAAAVNAEVVDVMRTDVSSEPTQGAPDTTPTLETMIKHLYFKSINKQETTSSEDAMYNVAGDTKIIKTTLSDDGNTFTKAAYISGA